MPRRGHLTPTTAGTARATRRILDNAYPDLMEAFGRSRLQETALSVYTSRVPAVSYLAWRRVAWASRLLALSATGTGAALDYGSGLGVMLPGLSALFAHVVACDIDPEVTEFMRERLHTPHVQVARTPAPPKGGRGYDAVVALDVLEHVDDIDTEMARLLAVTGPRGIWVISGPTENRLYRGVRRLSGTSGEGHVRTVADVFNAVPEDLVPVRRVRLPFGAPLFLVASFRRAGPASRMLAEGHTN